MNRDAELQALDAAIDAEYDRKTGCMSLKMAFLEARRGLATRLEEALYFCKSDGLLPFAWRGSKALVDGLAVAQEGVAV